VNDSVARATLHLWQLITCVPQWHCVVASCNRDAAGTREANLSKASGATRCNSPSAFSAHLLQC